MSSGITINVKGQELIERCEARAAHHRERAKECEAEAHHAKSRTKQNDVPLMTPNTLRLKTRQHRERADALVFLAKHLEAEKVYEGKVEYTARKKDGKWRIEEVRLPDVKVTTTLGADGKWVKK